MVPIGLHLHPILALGFALYALGLATVARWPRVSASAGVVLTLLQGAVLVGWLLELNVGVGARQWVDSPAAVAPPAALALTLLGVLLVLLQARGVLDRPLWAPLIGGTVVVLGATGLFVNLARSVRLVGWGEVARVPVATSVLLLVAGLLAIAVGVRRGLPRASWGAITLGLTGVLVAVLTWQLLRVQRGDWIQVTTSSTAETTGSVLEQQLLVYALALRVMAEEWESPATAPIAEWDIDAERTSAELSAFLGFVWVAPDGSAAWSYYAQRDPPIRPIELRQAALEAQRALAARPDTLVYVAQAGPRTVVALSMPMVIGDEDVGRMVGLLEGDLLIQRLIPPEIRDDFAVAVLAGGVVVSRHGVPQHVRHVLREVDSLGTRWQVVLWPNQAWVEQVRSGLPEVFLAFGVGLALAIALGADLAREARVRAWQLSGALRALRESHELLEQRVAERTEALRRANDELQRSNEDLEHFASVASHDLKAPLHTVSLYLQVLARHVKGDLPEQDAALIDRAHGAIGTMSALIDSLLEFARAGSVEQHPEPVALTGAVDRVLEALDGPVVEAGATIVRGDLDHTVHVDPAQLGQVLQNLVTNALKYRADRPLRIEIAAAPEDDMVRVEIRDNGVGVEPHVAERIFSMFDRGTGERLAPGTGIGLATCKKIVERHGGQIGVESDPGRGSTFWFTLPRAPRGDDAPA